MKQIMKNNIFGYIILAFLLLSGTGYIIVSNNKSSNLLTIKKRYISKLIETGLYKQAVEEYKTLADSGKAGRNETANIYYLAANIQADNLADNESALALYLHAKVYAHDVKLTSDIDYKIVGCMEKLGKSYDAARFLEQNVTLNTRTQKPSSAVIAKVGKRTITKTDLDEYIRLLPPQLQQQAGRYSKDKLTELLKQLIAEDLLLSSGKRKGYDRDTDLNKQLEYWKRQVILQRVLSDEIGDKGKPTEKEIELYYQAHKNELKNKDNKIQSFEESRAGIISKLTEEKYRVLQQELFNRLIQAEKVEIYENGL